MLCKASRELPSRDSWLYEVKQDGYRAMAVKDGKNVTLFSRKGKRLKFPGVLEMVSYIRVKSAVLDCELVALDREGKPCFEALAMKNHDCTVRLYAFDLLHVNGKNLCNRPIEYRKDRLRKLTDGSPLLFCPAFDCEPKMLAAEVKKLALEGIVAKRRGSTYEPGERSGAWVKVRVNQEKDFIIGGYAPGNPLDSVLVGYRRGKHLHFAGKVQAGLTPQLRHELFQRMESLRQVKCPFANLPDDRRDQWGEGVTAEDMESLVWVRPVLKVRVGFREWTGWKRLRHPTLQSG